jgi:hypothetical protein
VRHTSHREEERVAGRDGGGELRRDVLIRLTKQWVPAREDVRERGRLLSDERVLADAGSAGDGIT